MLSIWSRSLVWRIALSFLALALLVVVMAGALAYVSTRGTLETAAIDRLQLAANLKQNELLRWIDDERQDIELVASLTGVHDQAVAVLTTDKLDTGYRASHDALIKALSATRKDRTDFREMFILSGVGGEILVSTNPLSEGTYRVKDTFYTNGREATYIQPVYAWPVTLEPTVTISTPIKDTNGKIVGVFAVHLNMNRMDEIILERTGLGATGETYLVDSVNVFVSGQRFNQAAFPRGVHTVGIDAGVSGQNGAGLYPNYADIPVVGVYQWIDQLKVALIAEVSQDEAFTPANVLGRGILIVGAILAVLLTSGMYLLARRIAAPILAITKTAQLVAKGDLSQTAPITTNDEVGTLALTFNQMTRQLQNAYADLRLSNEALEDRVAARTRDLQIAAEVSKEAVSIMSSEVLLPSVTELTREAFKLAFVAIFVYDPATNLLKQAAGSPHQTDLEFALDSADALVSQAARERQPIVINNLNKGAGFLSGIKSEAALPMIFRGQLLGILDLHATQKNRFSADDLRVLQTLADQIAVSIRNAQLFAETQAAQQQAERADRTKSMFLASMSHELRTPLNAIINFTTFVTDGDVGPVNEQQAMLLTQVVSSSNHLLSLINDVLDMSKIEAGTLNLMIQENVDLRRILNNVETTARGLLKNKTVGLRFNIAPDLPPIRADFQRVMQVLLNVISNACKFTSEGEIILTAAVEGDEVMISVKDSGPGIAPEDHAKVFEAFQQTETGLRQAGGTGLGMPISKNLVEAHGGAMWLESTVGQGATFYVRLPIKSETLVPILAR